MMPPRHISIAALLTVALLPACGGDDTDSNSGDGGTQDAGPGDSDAGVDINESFYQFDSRFEPGTSPVSKSGQTFRHVLISEMKSYLGGLTAQVDTTPPEAGDVVAALSFYFDFDSTTSGQVSLNIATTPDPLQSTFDDISSDKNLLGKLAGNDAATDHKNWNADNNFIGWNDGTGDTPTELIQSWFQQLDDLAVARIASPELGPDGNPVGSVFLTSDGLDLQQLLQKFLLGAVAFSQGTDDYLDTDVDGKGLLSSNARVDGEPYSELGHSWDEGFGYFGASIDYVDYTDDERAAKGGRDDYQGHHDTDSDGRIDLKAEYNFGHAVNCGKRDLDSVDGAKTTFGDDAFEAFRAGRALILEAGDELTEAQLTELTGYANTARLNWERCVAATVVHYINAVTSDMNSFGTESYDFAAHAKNWSELKGFALGLQFSPISPLNEGSRFADLHANLGLAPVLPNASDSAITDYKAALASARLIMKDAYGFDDANLEAW